MMLAGAQPWIPYMAQAAKGVGRVAPRSHAQKVTQGKVRAPSAKGPKAGKQTKASYLKGGGVYGGGVAGGIPSLAPRRARKPAIAPGFELL